MTGVFLSVLKTAKVVHVFQKDSKFDYSNYRPISLVSNIDEMLENLCIRDISITIILSITYSLDLNNISHSLINITKNIRKVLDDRNIGYGVFVDLQKAFDTVDHKILLAKLNHYRICGVSDDWFKSHLSNHNQYVSINEYESGLAALNCGIPQGSVLGSLLFLLYVNDLNQAIKFYKVHHFADGTNFLCLSNSIKLVNADLKHLANWLNTNKISLNIKN